MTDQTELPPDNPAIGLSFRLPLDDGTGREVVFQGFVPANCWDEQLNDLLDKLSRAGERQKAMVVLPSYQNILATKKEELVAATEAAFSARKEFEAQEAFWAREAAQSGRRHWKLTPQQNQLKQKLEASIGQHEQTMRVLEKQIEAEEKRVTLYKSRLGAEA